MKKWLLLLFLPAISWATGEGVPKVTPSTAVITVGGAVQFQTTFSVTWSLLPGSYGTISSTGLYHATTGYFQANNLSSAGTQLGPNDAIWNTDISGAPLDANSAAKIDFLRVEASTPHVTLQPTVPRNQYATGVSSQSIVFRSSPQNSDFFFMRSSFSRVEQASVMSNRPSELAQFGQDHHILGISTDTLQAQEIFNFYPAGTDSGAPNSNAESGCVYDPNGYALPDTTGGHGTCTTAAGLYFQPFILKNSELESGQINHMVFCTIDNGNNFNGFTWPATNSTNQCNDATRCIKYGTVLRLKSSYNCGNFSTAKAQAICQALKKYGCVDGDGGTALAIVADYDLMQSTGDFAAVFSDFSQGTSSVSWSDMEVVDVSGLMKSSFTANVDPANGFVTPSPFVQVLAKNTVDGQVSSTTIALQPVVVGWQNPAHQGNDAGVNVMAGTPQFTIPAWVTGSTDTVFTCSMTPTLGTIGTSSAGCLYTAPATQFNQVLISTVTIKSRIDPNHNSVSFYLTVFSSDAIRIRNGPAASGSDTKPPFDNNGNYTDSTTGNIYFESPANMFSNWNTRTTQGDATWPNQMYNQVDYGSGDKLFSAMVPSGTYVLTSYHGRKDNSSGDVTASSNCIESQFVLVHDTITLAPAALTPKIIVSTISVGSDFRFHWRIVGNSGSQLAGGLDNSHNFMSYWTLESTPTNGLPTITSANSASGVVNQAFSYTITAINSPTSYNDNGPPAWSSINTSNGVISGTPNIAAVTVATMSATNAVGSSSSSLTITIVSSAPEITSSLTASGTVGQSFSYQITGTNSPTSYDAQDLPNGLSVGFLSGLISGTPTVAAVSTATISASNAGGTGSAVLTITINSAPPPPPPPPTSPGASVGMQGTIKFQGNVQAR